MGRPPSATQVPNGFGPLEARLSCLGADPRSRTTTRPASPTELRRKASRRACLKHPPNLAKRSPHADSPLYHWPRIEPKRRQLIRLQTRRASLLSEPTPEGSKTESSGRGSERSEGLPDWFRLTFCDSRTSPPADSSPQGQPPPSKPRVASRKSQRREGANERGGEGGLVQRPRGAPIEPGYGKPNYNSLAPLAFNLKCSRLEPLRITFTAFPNLRPGAARAPHEA